MTAPSTSASATSPRRMERRYPRPGSGTGRVMRAGGQQFDALQAEPQCVHGVLGVVSVCGHEFGPVGVRARAAGHGGLLAPQVAQEPVGRQPGHEPVRVVSQLCPSVVAEHHVLVGNEQDQQHGRVPGEGQPRPLACGVDDDVQVTSAGAVRHPSGPVPGRVPFVLLERNPRADAGDAARHSRQARHEPGGSRHRPISSRSSWPETEVPCTPEPTCTRKIMPCCAICRASSEACGWAKPEEGQPGQ